MREPLSPSWQSLVWVALPVLGVMAALAWQRLGQIRRMAVAIVRMLVQVMLLGVVLEAVFASGNPWVVALVALVMLAASAYSVSARQQRGSWALRLQAFGSMALGAAVTMIVGTRLALGVEPWYDPRTIVPIVGMVLGNSLNGVSLGAERLESELRAERDRIELRLALGATARQAAAPALRAAIAAALRPTINSMMVAGIVSVPGMMTGQILAGAPVGDALRYQLLIYFMLAGTVGISTLVLLAIRLHGYFTPAHQLRHEALA